MARRMKHVLSRYTVINKAPLAAAFYHREAEGVKCQKKGGKKDGAKSEGQTQAGGERYAEVKSTLQMQLSPA